MRRIQRVRILGAAAAALVGAGTVGTAYAATPAVSINHIIGGGNYSGVILNGLTVAFECHAAAPGAIETEVDSCRLTTRGSASPIALPGEAAATAGTANVPFAPFQLCWTVSATYLNTGRVSSSGCTILPSVGGVPTLAGTGVSES